MTSEFNIRTLSLNQKGIEQAVRVEVIFGMPAKDCLYHGICKIEPDFGATPNGRRSGTCASATAVVTRTPTGQLLFRFSLAEMPPSIYFLHFGSGYFVVLEDVYAPEFLTRFFDMTCFVFKRAIYPVAEEGDILQVRFGA